MHKTLLLGAALLGAYACTRADIDGEEAAAKDTDEAVVRTQTDEPLYSLTNKVKICEEIRVTEAACSDLSFTVTEIAESTQYSDSGDGEPVTMQLKVRVKDPATLYTWDAALTRVLGSDFVMDFEATIEGGVMSELHDYIADVAEQCGDDGCYDGELDEEILDPVNYFELPEEIQSLGESYATDRAQAEGIRSEYGDEGHFIIRKDHVPVGYVVAIWDYNSDPQWDGSGVNLYIDSNGVLVEAVAWEG